MEMFDFRNAAYYFASYKKLEKAYTDFQLNALDDYEIAVLSCLGRINTASEIALHTDVSKALVSRSVKFLKEKGYITTTVSDEDKREQYLALTEEGQKIALLIDEANRRFFATAFANFEDTEKKVLTALLKMMMRNLDID